MCHYGTGHRRSTQSCSRPVRKSEPGSAADTAFMLLNSQAYACYTWWQKAVTRQHKVTSTKSVRFTEREREREREREGERETETAEKTICGKHLPILCLETTTNISTVIS